MGATRPAPATPATRAAIVVCGLLWVAGPGATACGTPGTETPLGATDVFETGDADTVADSAADTVADAVADTVADSAADAVADSAADAAADAVADTAADVVADAVADTAADVVADAVAETVVDAAADAAADSAADTAADSAADLGTDSAADSAADADAAADGDAGPLPPVDCDALPQGPFELVKLQGPIASEDLAFDADGHIVGSNDKAIFKSPHGGSPQLFVPDMKFRAGMRFLPSGQLVLCDDQLGRIVRVDSQGVKHTLLSGLSYPNGLAVDLAGWVYFTEHDAGVVWRLHPFTGEATVIADAIENPNGLTFSPDYKTLYIDGFNGDPTVWALSVSPDGVPGKLVPWASFGTGWHDGMGVDACGNVYVADYEQTKIYRVRPDGSDAQVIIDGSGLDNAYLPNMQWGTGVGGWDPRALYIPDGWNKGVFEVVVGVPGKDRAYP